jgi:hypothetical protein
MANEIKESIYLAHHVFREIAKHELSLAASLQNLAPGATKQSQSALYLEANSAMLKELAEKIKALANSSALSDES